ncbi:VOC family protein [Allosalinactinospora lopnorensis]|uniref:VOC family protein n=1 Tax=Allosalinactinospora lopnorensis TaxID=1352348 RepID=UPI00191C6491|nr:VOC family protein [Allosalinactinospora lopnorensis]
MAQRPFRVSLRVGDVQAATEFYRGLGFEEVGLVPDPGGRTVFAILQRGDVHLCVDALVGLPFPDTEREQRVRQGPRGLGVVIGIEVDDLEATYAYCRETGCEITREPMDEAWGDRVFECVDPFGYVWEFSRPIAEKAGWPLSGRAGSAAPERPRAAAPAAAAPTSPPAPRRASSPRRCGTRSCSASPRAPPARRPGSSTRRWRGTAIRRAPSIGWKRSSTGPSSLSRCATAAARTRSWPR